MKPQWFVHKDGAVLGPFTTVDIDQQISAGTMSAECLIWARGSNEWLPMSQWKTLSSKIEDNSKNTAHRVWYCDSGAGQPAGPLTQNELVEHLKGLNRWDVVTLWGTGLLKWIPLYEAHDVMDLVGISRRGQPRAPLLGTIGITAIGNSIPSQVVPSLTVSVGGFGVKNAGFLSRGDHVQVVIKSRDLQGAINATGEVLYVSRTGDAGIKFVELPGEAYAILHDHVRRFQDQESAAA